jgi:hypothetical protein
MKEILKKYIPGLHTIIKITEDEEEYNVHHIYFNPAHRQKYDDTYVRLSKDRLKGDMRDYKLDDILSFGLSLEEEDSFDVESVIYNEEQRKKLDELRKNKSVTVHVRKLINELRKEYTEQFRVGDPVFYKNTPGNITFKHEDKDNSLTRWTVKIKDIEYRYVCGLEIGKRKVEDLSHIPVDEKLNKLSTEKLLKMYKRSRVKGVGNPLIKRILNEREHVKLTDEKVVIVSSDYISNIR